MVRGRLFWACTSLKSGKIDWQHAKAREYPRSTTGWDFIKVPSPISNWYISCCMGHLFGSRGCSSCNTVNGKKKKHGPRDRKTTFTVSIAEGYWSLACAVISGSHWTCCRGRTEAHQIPTKWMLSDRWTSEWAAHCQMWLLPNACIRSILDPSWLIDRYSMLTPWPSHLHHIITFRITCFPF